VGEVILLWTQSPGFSRLNACLGSGILPRKPDPAEAGTPNAMSGLEFQHSLAGYSRTPAEAGTPEQPHTG